MQKSFAPYWLAATLLLLCAIPSASAQPRTNYNFNPGWLRHRRRPRQRASRPAFDDSSWKQVTLPHAWNEDAAFKVTIHEAPHRHRLVPQALPAPRQRRAASASSSSSRASARPARSISTASRSAATKTASWPSASTSPPA